MKLIMLKAPLQAAVAMIPAASNPMRKSRPAGLSGPRPRPAETALGPGVPAGGSRLRCLVSTWDHTLAEALQVPSCSTRAPGPGQPKGGCALMEVLWHLLPPPSLRIDPHAPVAAAGSMAADEDDGADMTSNPAALPAGEFGQPAVQPA